MERYSGSPSKISGTAPSHLLRWEYGTYKLKLKSILFFTLNLLTLNFMLMPLFCFQMLHITYILDLMNR